LKYRIVTGDSERGSLVVSACLSATIPTGSYKNGAPTLRLRRRCWRGRTSDPKTGYPIDTRRDLAAGDTNELGRPVAWNTTAQYQLGKYLWPELESNATDYNGGPKHGKSQNFLTPGIVFSRFKLCPSDAKSRLGVGFAAGEQIARPANPTPTTTGWCLQEGWSSKILRSSQRLTTRI
jgi:hypothetical protein